MRRWGKGAARRNVTQIFYLEPGHISILRHVSRALGMTLCPSDAGAAKIMAFWLISP